MTKYCPICASEYLDSVTHCVDDGTRLTKEKPKTSYETAAYDIYAAANDIEAERIITLLNSEGVPATYYQSNVSSLPSDASKHFIITTPAKSRNVALALIQNARKDGVISDTGMFI